MRFLSRIFRNTQTGRRKNEDEVYLRATPLDPRRRRLLWMDPTTLGLFSAPNTVTMIQDGNRVIETVFSPQDIEWARRVNEYAVKAEQAARADQYPEAIGLYKNALELAPGCDLYLMSIGCCYANMGDTGRGLKYLEKANEFSPNEERIKRNLEGVRRTRAR